MRAFFSWRTIRDIVLIIFGTSIYGFGLVYLNIPNDLAEGGVTGITLILRALWGINPAISTLILNIPIIFDRWQKSWSTLISVYDFREPLVCLFWLAFWRSVPC